MRHHITSISENGKNLFFTSKYKGVFVHSNGKTVQLVNSSQLKGESENVHHTGDGLFITSQKGFYTFLQNRLEIVREFDNEIHISQILELPGFLILLTNKGNFHYSIKSKRLIPLNNWIKTKSGLIDQLRFGAVDGQKVMLVNEKLNEWLEIIINENGGIYSIQKHTNILSLSDENPVISAAFDKFEQKIVFLTTNNDLILFQKNEFRKVTKNYDKEFTGCTKVITDINGDIWLASKSYGLFKVSMEPFTKVLLHSEYNSPDLFCLHRSRKGDILLSKRDATTKIGNIYTNSPFVSYPFRTNSVVETDEILLLGTDEGVYQFDKRTKQIKPFILSGVERQKITYLGLFDGELFIGLDNSGLVRYSLADKTKKNIQGKWLPKYIYTAQQNKQEGKIYFGTNEGIFYLNQKTSTFYHLNKSKEIGFYVGVSIKDIFGNLWFTGDNGLFGILKNGENLVITDDKHFNSKLFYTLNSDNFGNLIVGTNKGLNIITVDELGNIIKRTVFTGQNGFGGYETNMRSQFQDDNSIFVGTIEGLFLVNTEILRKFPKPTPPIITSLVQETIDSQGNSFAFQFTTNNAKIQHLYYSYRIKGFQEEWSELSETAKILISNFTRYLTYRPINSYLPS